MLPSTARRLGSLNALGTIAKACASTAAEPSTSHPSSSAFFPLCIKKTGSRSFPAYISAKDILNFLEDPSLSEKDLRVEYNPDLVPRAWWVRYKDRTKRHSFARQQGPLRLGATSISVSELGMNDYNASLLDWDNSSPHSQDERHGRLVLMRCAEQLDTAQVEEFFQDYHLDYPKVTLLTNRGQRQYLLHFSTAEEAQQAVRSAHRKVVNNKPVYLRALP